MALILNGSTGVDLPVPLPVSEGGIGVDSLPNGAILVGNGSNAVQGIAPNIAGNVLTSNGTSWVSSLPPQAVLVSDTEPTVGPIGSLYFNSILFLTYISNGTEWLLVSDTAPSTTGGTVIIPDGFELQNLSYNLGIDFQDLIDPDTALTYTLESGTLPTNIVLPSFGQTYLTGTASSLSNDTTYTFAIRATDTGNRFIIQNYSWTIKTVIPITTGGVVTIPTINEKISASYDVNTNFTFTSPSSIFSSYSLVSGSLPAGLSLNTSTGIISGTASAVSSNTVFTFTIRGTDTDGDFADQNYSWTVNTVAPVSTGGVVTIPQATTNPVSYNTSSNFTFSSPSAALLSYSLVSGSLPTGTSLNTSTGVISGTASSNSTFTFTIRATDTDGDTANQQYSWSIAVPPTGEASYTTAGTYSWTAPAYVTSVSVVAVGGGGYYGAGGLGWKNNIPVNPGNSYTVTVGNVGQPSSFINTSTVAGNAASGNTGGGYVGDGGGNGGTCPGGTYPGGGGAGGYTGNGGPGASYAGSGSPGTGGGGGGGGGGEHGVTGGTGGGGVGILGQGTSGYGGGFTQGGGGGSGGENGQPGNPGGGINPGGLYGGNGKNGAVRIIWGPGRSFPTAAN